MMEASGNCFLTADGIWKTPFTIDIAWYTPGSVSIAQSTHGGECALKIDTSQRGMVVKSSTYMIGDPQRLLDDLCKSGYRPSDSVRGDCRSPELCCQSPSGSDVEVSSGSIIDVDIPVGQGKELWCVEQSDEHA